jgi:hypothetical protein
MVRAAVARQLVDVPALVSDIRDWCPATICWEGRRLPVHGGTLRVICLVDNHLFVRYCLRFSLLCIHLATNLLRHVCVAVDLLLVS